MTAINGIESKSERPRETKHDELGSISKQQFPPLHAINIPLSYLAIASFPGSPKNEQTNKGNKHDTVEPDYLLIEIISFSLCIK